MDKSKSSLFYWKWNRSIDGREKEKKQIFIKIGLCAFCGRLCCGTWEYLAFPLSCCALRGRDFPSGLSCFGTDLRLYHDYCGECHRQNDKKESGRCLRAFWKGLDVPFGRLDQCGHSDSHCTLLFRNRRLGIKVPLCLCSRRGNGGSNRRIFYRLYRKRDAD